MIYTQTYSANKIAQLLTDATWDYQFNMQHTDEGIMDSLLSDLEGSHFTESEVEEMINSSLEDADIEQYKDEEDQNIWIARMIGNSLAKSKVKCPYETITFIPVI